MGSDDIKGHWWMSIIFKFILLHSWHYLTVSSQSAQITVELVSIYSKDRQSPRQNFLLLKTNVSTSKLKATSLNSIHINVTKSTNDCSKAEEKDLG